MLTTFLRIYLFFIFLLWIILLSLFSIRVRTRFFLIKKRYRTRLDEQLLTIFKNL